VRTFSRDKASLLEDVNWNIVPEGVVGIITNVIFENELFALTVAHPYTGLYTRRVLFITFANVIMQH
jgi:hypothetical protein